LLYQSAAFLVALLRQFDHDAAHNLCQVLAAREPHSDPELRGCDRIGDTQSAFAETFSIISYSV
jgi:hypothetical protein